MVNATNSETENLSVQEEFIMDNAIHQQHENSIRVFQASLPKKLFQRNIEGNSIPDAAFKKKLADLKKKKNSKKRSKKSPKIQQNYIQRSI